MCVGILRLHLALSGFPDGGRKGVRPSIVPWPNCATRRDTCEALTLDLHSTQDLSGNAGRLGRRTIQGFHVARSSPVSDMHSTPVRVDILAGMTTAFALVPECIACALVVHLNPLMGLYGAIVICTLTALLGGRPGMISGAAGSMAVVIVDLVVQHGVAYRPGRRSTPHHVRLPAPELRGLLSDRGPADAARALCRHWQAPTRGAPFRALPAALASGRRRARRSRVEAVYLMSCSTLE